MPAIKITIISYLTAQIVKTAIEFAFFLMFFAEIDLVDLYFV